MGPSSIICRFRVPGSRFGVRGSVQRFGSGFGVPGSAVIGVLQPGTWNVEPNLGTLNRTWNPEPWNPEPTKPSLALPFMISRMRIAAVALAAFPQHAVDSLPAPVGH
jgi:hypothetical protein